MITSTSLVAVILGLSQVAKQFIPNKFIPLLNVVLGILAGITVLKTGDISSDIFTGLAVGLSAGGFFDLTKLAKK